MALIDETMSYESAKTLLKFKLLQKEALDYAAREKGKEIVELVRRYRFSVCFEPLSVDGEAVKGK